MGKCIFENKHLHWECFQVQLLLAVSVYILSGKGANQLQILYIRTGKHPRKPTFLLKVRSSTVFPIFFEKFEEVLRQQLKYLLWKVMSQHIQPIKITPRFCKLSSLVFLCVFVSYINRNHKDATHPWGKRLDTTLYIACQPEFLEIHREWIFFFKKSGDKNQENQEKWLAASIYNDPPQKIIFSLVSDKSIRILLNSV